MQTDLGKDFFEIFGLPRTFDIDTADLAMRYREIQRNIHPDKFSNASDQERRLSMQFTAHINEAFQTLKDPVKRGRYLLRLNGIDIDAETDTTMDADFLMEQMELREALEEARHAPNRNALATTLARDVGQRLQDKGERFAQALKSPESMAQARNLVREMQFLDKVLREMRDMDEEST